MECVYQCPGLAIFGYQTRQNRLFLPIEYEISEGTDLFLVDNNGKKVGEGVLETILLKPNRTNIARVKALNLTTEELIKVRGFIAKDRYPEKVEFKPIKEEESAKSYICHCEDITAQRLLDLIGDRKILTADELKHITRIGMGACRGSRCLPRAKQFLKKSGIEVSGEFTPRGPLANLINIGQLINSNSKGESREKIFTPLNNQEKEVIKCRVLIAGGGIGGTSLFRYFAEAGYKPILINKNAGSSWRNIAGGRATFSLPALADIAHHNLELFRELQKLSNIEFKDTRYTNFIHDEATYNSLEASQSWSDGYMVEAKDFQKEISPYFNPDLKLYSHALITNNCWQASPGKSIDLLREIGKREGGEVLEDTELIDVEKVNNKYRIIIKRSDNRYIEYRCEHFVNALGGNADKFAKRLGYETHLYPVKHQAFITKRLPLLGCNGNPLDMLIDRAHRDGFSAIYGQQLAETGQIIGCASPINDATEAFKNLKTNTQEFTNYFSKLFSSWIPQLKGVAIQATWSGDYVEPRYIIDPEAGLFIGMRGHGFMLSQYIAKLYVDSIEGKIVPDYFKELNLDGNGLSENSFK